MMSFIPIFPLSIVVYPDEQLNLHIFEPRYKQLINECVQDNKAFGIPTILDKDMGELGTRMEVIEIVKEYENGELDIRTKGTAVFKILEVVKEVPDKLYSGAIVNYPANKMEQGDSVISKAITTEVRRLYDLLNVSEKFPAGHSELHSYQIAHYVGFSLQQEYELLGLFEELQRLEYIRRHLNSIVPVINELEQMKARIKMNGHFRNLS
jgi:Lon protease-like protein